MVPAGRVLVFGTLHSVSSTDIPAREAAPSYRDEEGKWHAAVEAREAYTVHDAVILTSELQGGFLTVRTRDGEGPDLSLLGERVTWVVRAYATRERSASGWFNRVMYYYEKDAADVRVSVNLVPVVAKLVDSAKAV